MAISFRISIKSGDEKIEVLISKGHLDHLGNIVEKYDSIKNEAQALDFAIKSVGYDADVVEGVAVNGVTYLRIHMNEKDGITIEVENENTPNVIWLPGIDKGVEQRKKMSRRVWRDRAIQVLIATIMTVLKTIIDNLLL